MEKVGSFPPSHGGKEAGLEGYFVAGKAEEQVTAVCGCPRYSIVLEDLGVGFSITQNTKGNTSERFHQDFTHLV